MHRTEAQVNPWLPAIAPRLLWQVEQAGWLLLGFEHVTGQHANLSPGSPDLPLIADTVSALASELTPCPPVPVPTLGDKFARMAAWPRLRDNPPHTPDDWTRAKLDRFTAQEPHAIELGRGQHTRPHRPALTHSRTRMDAAPTTREPAGHEYITKCGFP